MRCRRRREPRFVDCPAGPARRTTTSRMPGQSRPPRPAARRSRGRGRRRRSRGSGAGAARTARVSSCFHERGGRPRRAMPRARGPLGDILFFTDSDVTLPPGHDRPGLAVLDAHPGDAVIGFVRRCPRRPELPLAVQEPRAPLRSPDRARGRLHVLGRVRGGAPRARSCASGIRRALPPLEHRGHRARVEAVAAGVAIRLDKSLQATHLKRWTPAGLVRSEIFDRAIPWTRLILENGRMPDDLNLRWSGRVAVAWPAGWRGAGRVAVPGARPVAVVLAALEVAIEPRWRGSSDGRAAPCSRREPSPGSGCTTCAAAAGFGMGIAMHLFARRRPLPAPAQPAPVAGEPGSR